MIALKEIYLKVATNYTDDLNYLNSCWDEILANYNAKNRHYHNMTHLTSMFDELSHEQGFINNLDAVTLAIFYHDIVYKATRKDNELQSAVLFEKRFENSNYSDVKKVSKMIELTKNHEISDDSDTNYFLDIDMAILGSEEHRYKQYRLNVRKEYSIYPSFMYKAGRRKVITSFLNQNHIYHTEYFRNKYEAIARTNLKNELLSI